jgi:ribosomal protein S18 acetylase RimI-like enzyme
MTAPAIRIRPCRPDDLPALRELTTAAFGGVSIDHGIEEAFGPVHGHDWRWRKARHVDDDFTRDPAGLFVAEGDGGELIGYVSSWSDAEAGIGHIPNLVVRDEHRGKGIGRELLLHVLAHFRGRGLTHARIETLVQNKVGRGLYESLGFREVARQIHFAMEL